MNTVYGELVFLQDGCVNMTHTFALLVISTCTCTVDGSIPVVIMLFLLIID